MGISVSYEEKVGSSSFQIAEGGASGTRIFTVAWGDAVTFAQELYGRYQAWPSGAYVPPNQFPYLPYLYCSDVQVEGFGIQSESSNAEGLYIVYEWAKVTARYTPMIGVDPEDPEVVEEENISVSGELETLPAEQYEWTAGSIPVKADILPVKVETTSSFSVTRLHVSSLPNNVISLVVGKINQNAWRSYSAGYALFIGADANRSITTDGAEDWEVTYNFLIKSHSWNHAYRDSSGNFEEVQTKNGNDTIYETDTFAALGV